MFQLLSGYTAHAFGTDDKSTMVSELASALCARMQLCMARREWQAASRGRALSAATDGFISAQDKGSKHSVNGAQANGIDASAAKLEGGNFSA